MTDQRISEVNIKETEDGYIIELKGDKDAIQNLIFSRRMFGGFGRRGPGEHRKHRGPRGHRHSRHHSHGEHGHHEHRGPRRRFDLGPWFEQDERSKGKIIDDDATTI